MADPETVVVVGAGFAGVDVAQALQGEREVVLVAPTESFVYLPMIHEILSETSLPRDVTLPLDEILPEVRHVHGRGRRVEGDRLITGDGEELTFDHLVVAIGAQPHDFGTEGVAEHALSFYSLGDALRANAELKHTATRIDDPLEVTVVGASFTGVEVAGEIATLLDKHDIDRKIRLLEARDTLFPGQSQRFREGVHEGLKRLDLELETETMVEQVGEDEIVATQDGSKRSWPSHATFWCAGVKPRSLEGVDPRVDRHLASRQRDDVYVVGDAARFPEDMDVPKLAQTAEDQADVAAHNILNPHDPVEYDPHVKGLLASIGEGYAVAELTQGPVFKGRIPWHVKRNLYKVKMSLT